MNLIGRRRHGSLNEFLNLTAAASCLIVVTEGLPLYKSARAEEMTMKATSDFTQWLKLPRIAVTHCYYSGSLALTVLQTEILNIMDV